MKPEDLDRMRKIDELSTADPSRGSGSIMRQLKRQGSQFTSKDFTGALKEHDVKISMDGRGRCRLEDMMKLLEKFERAIVLALISMMMLVVFLSTVELGWIIIKDIITPPIILLEIDELLEIFGFFLLILIGVELLETIKAYLNTHVIHVEVVLEVALIAISRKVIILDFEKYSDMTIIGIAAMTASLAIAFWLLKVRFRNAQPSSASAVNHGGKGDDRG